MRSCLYADAFEEQSVFPVIHVQDEHQAMANAAIAREAGCNGVFFIDHNGRPWQYLADIAEQARKEHPDSHNWHIGVNYLNLGAFQALASIPSAADCLWLDDAYLYEGSYEKALKLSSEVELKFRGPFSFAALAFKYQTQPNDLVLACSAARKLFDIAVTTGTGTGQAADIEKVIEISELLEEHPLALASGVTAENLANYYQYVDAYLVATSITDPKTEILIPAAVRELVSAAAEARAAKLA